MRHANTLKSRGTAAHLELHHLEIFLASTAFGASPIDRNILPTRPGRQTMLGGTSRLCVNPATNQAHPGFSIGHSLKRPSNRIRSLYLASILRSRQKSAALPGDKPEHGP